MPEWNNYVMRKYGQSIRKKIAEAYKPFNKGLSILTANKIKEKLDKTDMVDYAKETLDE